MATPTDQKLSQGPQSKQGVDFELFVTVSDGSNIRDGYRLAVDVYGGVIAWRGYFFVAIWTSYAGNSNIYGGTTYV